MILWSVVQVFRCGVSGLHVYLRFIMLREVENSLCKLISSLTIEQYNTIHYMLKTFENLRNVFARDKTIGIVRDGPSDIQRGAGIFLKK